MVAYHFDGIQLGVKLWQEKALMASTLDKCLQHWQASACARFVFRGSKWINKSKSFQIRFITIGAWGSGSGWSGLWG
jgi:hypothetical protein